MWLEVFVRGVLIGLVASIPLGPIGVMCIQRTLSKNRQSGFISGLGAASADLIYASIALFSLSVVMSFIENNMGIIKVLGGISIVVVGTSIMLKNPVIQIRRNRAGKGSLWSDFISLFFVTLANPAYILVFVALFAALGVNQSEGSPLNGVMMMAGVLCGTSLWWFILTFSVNLIRKRFRPRHLLWINRISGSVIIVLGVVTILSIFISTNKYITLP